MGEKGLHDIKNSCAILFRQKRLRELRFQIRPSCKIHQIVPVLDSIAYTPPLANKEHVAYALLELINNSLRAHREKSIPAPISLRIRSTGSALHIEVRDRGVDSILRAFRMTFSKEIFRTILMLTPFYNTENFMKISASVWDWYLQDGCSIVLICNL